MMNTQTFYQQLFEQVQTNVKLFSKVINPKIDIPVLITVPQFDIRESILANIREEKAIVADLFQDSIGAELNDLQEYVNNTETFINEMQRRTAGLLEGDEHHWRLSEYFPFLMRTSLIVTCYSLFEYKLKELCGFLHTIRSLGERWNINYERNQPDIDRVMAYMRQELSLDVPITGEPGGRLWNNICFYGRIRNIIAHDNGYLDETNRRNNGVRQFIESKNRLTGSINIDEQNYLEVTTTFCNEIIQDIREFLENLRRINWPDE